MLIVRSACSVASRSDLEAFRNDLSDTTMSDDDSSMNQYGDSFFSTLLTPGSSLHPTFLLLLDGAFVLLLVVFLALLWLTSGSIHIFVLISVELGLWASVKWYVLLFLPSLQ